MPFPQKRLFSKKWLPAHIWSDGKTWPAACVWFGEFVCFHEWVSQHFKKQSVTCTKSYLSCSWQASLLCSPHCNPNVLVCLSVFLLLRWSTFLVGVDWGQSSPGRLHLGRRKTCCPANRSILCLQPNLDIPKRTDQILDRGRTSSIDGWRINGWKHADHIAGRSSSTQQRRSTSSCCNQQIKDDRAECVAGKGTLVLWSVHGLNGRTEWTSQLCRYQRTYAFELWGHACT